MNEKNTIKTLTFLGDKDSIKAILNSGVCNNSSFGSTIIDGNTLDVVIQDVASVEDVRSLIESAQKNSVYLNVPSAKMLEERFGECLIPKTGFIENIEEGQPVKLYLSGEGSREDIETLFSNLYDYEFDEIDDELEYEEKEISEDYYKFRSLREGIWGGEPDKFLNLTHHAEGLYENTGICNFHCEVYAEGKWHGGNEHANKFKSNFNEIER